MADVVNFVRGKEQRIEVLFNKLNSCLYNTTESY